MKPQLLKQAEIFAFLALIFLIGVYLLLIEPEPPPIIVLSEAEQSYRFEIGKAEISADFDRALRRDIVPLLDSLSRKCKCDLIEVVGHTDGMPVRNRSNLDDLADAFNRESMEDLQAGSNMDLGMMRALSIINLLEQERQGGRLPQIRYFSPYSAGHMILLDYDLTTAEHHGQDDSTRRRIEIRLRRAPGADLHLTQTIVPTTVNTGDTITVTLTVVNDGPDATSGIQIADRLPEGLAYISHTGIGRYDTTNGLWMVGSLDRDSSKTLAIHATVADSGSVTNTAEIVSHLLPDPDSRAANGVDGEDDQASVTVIRRQQP